MHETIYVETPKGDSLSNISENVQGIIEERGVRSGTCILVVPHTTAAITINSYLDPNTAVDIVADVRRIVPTRTDFEHIFDTPADAAGHIKASIIGNSETVLIEEGKLLPAHQREPMDKE